MQILSKVYQNMDSFPLKPVLIADYHSFIGEIV